MRIKAFTKAFAFLYALTCSTYVFAHGTGHGKSWGEEKGPSGGNLSSVVAAKDSELGAEATTLAVAEWKRSDSSIDITLWNVERTKSLKFAAKPIKWIFLGEKLGKPVVHEMKMKKGASSIQFSTTASRLPFSLKDKLPSVEQMEVILTDLEGISGKSVFIFTPIQAKL